MPDPTRSTVGSRLRAAREAAGMSAEQVGTWWASTAGMRPSGCEFALLSMEGGRLEAYDYDIVRFATMYRCRERWLSTGEGPMREDV